MGDPRGRLFDRAALASALVLALLLGRELAALRAAASPGGEAASAPGAPSVSAPSGLLDRARALVDGNGPGAREEAALLTSQYPRDPEGWELLARFHQGAGEKGAAVRAWARALKLSPELADEGSPRFRGDLIGSLAEAEFARLREARSRGSLTTEEKEELEAVYYLRRRLAGGCE